MEGKKKKAVNKTQVIRKQKVKQTMYWGEKG